MRRILLALLLLFGVVFPVTGQDGFNLPSALYVLLSSGVVERYGLGAEGVRVVTPVDTFVVDMAAAPDGNWLAYRTQQALTLRNMFTDQETQLEGASSGIPAHRGRGDTLAWTAAGDALAYTTLSGARVYFNVGATAVFSTINVSPLLHLAWSPEGRLLAAEAENNIWWIYRREGTQMILTSAIPFSYGTTWISPSELVFAPDTGGLFIMDMAQGNKQTLVLDDTTWYHLPYLQPDGTLLAYARGKNDRDLNAEQGRLVRVDLAARRSQVLGESVVDLQDVRWSPDGGLLVKFSGGVLALVNRTTGDTLPLPIASAVAYSWDALSGAQVVNGLRLSADGFFIAEDANGVDQVWRLPADGSQPVMLTVSPTDITAYAVSGNRRTVVYASEGKLWSLALSGSSEPVQLAEGDGIDEIRFSPDGRRVVFVTQSSEAQPEGGIWWALADGSARPELLLRNGPAANPAVYAPPFYRTPLFSPTVNALLVTIGGSESRALGLFDLSAQELLTVGSYDSGLWSVRGRILAYGSGIDAGAQQIFSIATDNLSLPQVVGALQSPLFVKSAAETTRGTLRVAAGFNTPGPVLLQVLEFAANGGPAQVLGSAGFMIGPQFSPDGRFIAGYAYPGGGLMVYDVEGGRLSVINGVVSASGFRWGG